MKPQVPQQGKNPVHVMWIILKAMVFNKISNVEIIQDFWLNVQDFQDSASLTKHENKN